MGDRRFDVITFDCYGTLIDWAAGIGVAFVEAAARDGIALDSGRVVDVYLALEPSVEAERFRLYRDVLAETARRAAAELGWSIGEEAAQFLPASIKDWPAFPDTNAALERLAAGGYSLAILSNVDDDLLAASLEHLSVPFDLLVTAEQIHSYKPAHGHFLAARRHSGNRRWLHAAQSYFHDVVPARSLGIPVAWINRRGQSPAGDVRPDYEFPTLTELVDWLSQP